MNNIKWMPETEKEVQKLVKVTTVYGWTKIAWEVVELLGLGGLVYLIIKLFAELGSFAHIFGL